MDIPITFRAADLADLPALTRVMDAAIGELQRNVLTAAQAVEAAAAELRAEVEGFLARVAA